MSYFAMIDYELGYLGIREEQDKNLVCDLASMLYSGNHTQPNAIKLMRALGEKYGYRNVGDACRLVQAYYNKPKCRTSAQNTDTSPQQVAQNTLQGESHDNSRQI